MSRNGVYTDITPRNWSQAVEGFELNYDFMHTYYLYGSYISYNYCHWLMQIIVFSVKFQCFPKKVDWWGGKICAKCSKTA